MPTAATLTVADLLAKRARSQPGATALTDGVTSLSYAQLEARVRRLASALRQAGVAADDRIALLSENRIEYIELELAAAQLGAIIACLNWRLADPELQHCIRLVTPLLAIVSPRYAATLARIAHGVPRVIVLGDEFDRLRADAVDPDTGPPLDPESGLVILYTSGTTGLPKGALISQRAMLARAQVFASDYAINAEHSFVAWSPLFHMAATDHALATLMLGGKVIVHDGLQLGPLCELLTTERLGWLLAMPGMIDPLIDALKSHRTSQHRPLIAPRMVGAMADLVPRHQIAELTALLGAPYLNSFGSTETGLPPASATLLAPGLVPASLSKRESGWCRIRLVDDQDREVAIGMPGELTIRSPALFSGYWNADATPAQDLRGGWFHMGDVFLRHHDGSLDFVDRVKYLIKSGGENIYPAEIERVLLAHPAVADAAVVRKPDPHWGEVPVAFVALQPGAVCDAQTLIALCRDQLARYKLPREFRFIEVDALPRSSTGKIQRHEIEQRML